jgi:hypothetical protein
MFRFEFGYPYSSCYTEPDLRYLAAKSKSLSFNRSRFVSNSGWMGISKTLQTKRMADIVESKYFIDRKPGFLSKVGSNLGDYNHKPFFKREENWVVFTVRALFAGHDDDKRSQSLRESCDAKCFVCGARIESEGSRLTDSIYDGVILDFNTHRYEIVCDDCYWGWMRTDRPWIKRYELTGYRTVRYVDVESQISFTRFVLNHSMATNH